jgi:hypothetical protein
VAGPPRLRARDTQSLLAFAGEIATCREATQLNAQLEPLIELIGAGRGNGHRRA